MQKSGVECTPAQAALRFGTSTLTDGGKFCTDINGAIISGILPIEADPDEGAFLHKANGDRCNFQINATSAMYLTNPSNIFFENYVFWGLQKVQKPVILDGLRPDWSGVLLACGGVPKEYADVETYYEALAGLADYVFSSKLQPGGVMGNIREHWYRYQYLNPLVCEPCLVDLETMSTVDLLYKATELDNWRERGKTVIMQEPDLGCVKVVWEKGLNLRETASMHNAGNIGFLYRDNKFHPLAIETNSEGTFAKYSEPGWVAMWLKSNGKTYAESVTCE